MLAFYDFWERENSLEKKVRCGKAKRGNANQPINKSSTYNRMQSKKRDLEQLPEYGIHHESSIERPVTWDPTMVLLPGKGLCRPGPRRGGDGVVRAGMERGGWGNRRRYDEGGSTYLESSDCFLSKRSARVSRLEIDIDSS